MRSRATLGRPWTVHPKTSHPKTLHNFHTLHYEMLEHWPPPGCQSAPQHDSPSLLHQAFARSAAIRHQLLAAVRRLPLVLGDPFPKGSGAEHVHVLVQLQPPPPIKKCITALSKMQEPFCVLVYMHILHDICVALFIFTINNFFVNEVTSLPHPTCSENVIRPQAR